MGNKHCRLHQWFYPVSYTHLDVYKRQELPDANAALRAAFTFINEGKEDEQQGFRPRLVDWEQDAAPVSYTHLVPQLDFHDVGFQIIQNQIVVDNEMCIRDRERAARRKRCASGGFYFYQRGKRG